MALQDSISNNYALFSTGDPITKYLRGKLKLGNFSATFLVLFFITLPMMIYVWVNDLWFINEIEVYSKAIKATLNIQIGFLEDFNWMGTFATATFGVVYTFFWMQEGVQDVLTGLKNNKVLGIGDEDFKKFTEKFDKQYSHPIWAKLTFLALIPYTFLGFRYVQLPHLTWYRVDGLAHFLQLFFYYVYFSLLVLAIVRVLISIFWFNKLFKENKPKIRVLFPDGAGGLSPLSGFSVKLGYLISFLGFAILVVIIGEGYVRTGVYQGFYLNNETPILFFAVLLYLTIAPVAFFAPIGAAKKAMVDAREGFLRDISDQHEIENTILLDKICNPNKYKGKESKIKENIDKVDQLEMLYKKVSKFPIWPFNTSSIVRFTSSVLSPFGAILLTVVLDNLIGKLIDLGFFG